MEQWAIALMADATVKLSDEDLRLLRFGPQPYLPHEVIRYNLLKLKQKHN